MRRDLLIVLAVVALLGLLLPRDSSPKFGYHTLEAAGRLTYLKNPRLLCTSEAAHELWSRGQLTIRDEFQASAGLVEDFDGDGTPDRALPVRTERSYLLLVFTPANQPTRLLATIDYLTPAELEDPGFVRTLARRCAK
jgi:hypothetical protein